MTMKERNGKDLETGVEGSSLKQDAFAPADLMKEEPLILRFHHADIIIPKGAEEEARKFYCEFLGFREIPKPTHLLKNGGLWLQLGGVEIHLSIQPGVDPRLTKSHLAYEVSDLEKLREKLKKVELTFHEGTSVPGFIRGDIRDPFGNRIEFLQAAPPPSEGWGI